MAETISSAESGAIPLTETMLTKKGVEELIATVRKGGITPKGSCAFASLPTPAEAKLGWMYNVSDAFTTTADWVEGAGKKYPAGTNVYVCNPSGSTYKWDALPGEGLQLTTDTPQPNGTAAAGSATTAARADHVHATDTTRAAAADLTSHTGNTTAHITAEERTAWNGKQGKITASGLLKGDGSGGVTAAVAGTDYATPSSVATAQSTAEGAATRLAAIETAAGTLLTNLSNAALADASMTNAHTIKTAVLSLIDFLKAFAAASDNNASTTHTPAS